MNDVFVSATRLIRRRDAALQAPSVSGRNFPQPYREQTITAHQAFLLLYVALPLSRCSELLQHAHPPGWQSVRS